jgi:self-protective colicin-like immunity protein
MSSHPTRSRDIATYISLMDDFISDKMSAVEFEKSYLSAIKSERRMLADDVFPILQELFEDADAYVPYPDLRTDHEDLDDDQLRACAIRARRALRELGFN